MLKNKGDRKLKAEDFNPYVRVFLYRKGVLPYKKRVCAFDHRLFYVCAQEIEFSFLGESKHLTAGDMIIIPPAVPYKLQFKDDKGAEYYLLNFDFVFDAQRRKSITPVEEELFDKKQIFSLEHPQEFDQVLVLKQFAEAKAILDAMREAKGQDTIFREQLWSALLKNVLVTAQIVKKGGESKKSENKLVRAVKKWVKENIANAPTNVGAAHALGYHPNYLNRLFLSQTGSTLYDYIMSQRVLAAKERLARGEQSISEIAQELGFCDTSYFSAFFKRETGISPKQYREQIR